MREVGHSLTCIFFGLRLETLISIRLNRRGNYIAFLRLGKKI
jgi:hypothetical protein